MSGSVLCASFGLVGLGTITGWPATVEDVVVVAVVGGQRRGVLERIRALSDDDPALAPGRARCRGVAGRPRVGRRNAGQREDWVEATLRQARRSAPMASVAAGQERDRPRASQHLLISLDRLRLENEPSRRT